MPAIIPASYFYIIDPFDAAESGCGYGRCHPFSFFYDMMGIQQI